MNEISQLLQQRFGLSPDQAEEAETAILNLLRSKVPTQFQGMFDSFAGQTGRQAGDQAQTESGDLLCSAENILGMKI